MERLFSRTKTTRDVFLDPAHRMSQRPGAVKSGEGLGFQELGSSFGPPKSVVTYGKPSKSRFRTEGAPSAKPRRPPSHTPEDESDDELLLSSQNPIESDATPSSKHVANGNKSDIFSSEEETVRINGHVLTVHPDYKLSSASRVKKLRFKKNKSISVTDDATTDVAPPSSSFTDSQDLFKPISEDIEILDDPPPGRSSSRQKPSKISLARRTSPSTIRAAAPQFTDAKSSSTSRLSSSVAMGTSRPSAKPPPHPCIVTKPVLQRDSSPESTPCSAAQKRELPLRSKTSTIPANGDRERAMKQPHFPSPPRRELQEYPMSSRARKNVSDGARSGDVSSTKTKKAVISRAATFVHTPKLIPLPSPLRTKPVSRGTTFPNMSPLAPSRVKGMARAKSPDKDHLTEGPDKRSGPKPFPMSSQILAGIDRRSKSPSTRSLKSTKRASSDDSDAEQGRTAKKPKDLRSSPNLYRVLDTVDHLHQPMEDDSIDLGYTRDPSKMCPYCDEELPFHPTLFLKHLLTTARKKSVPDPRPRNRGGLKAPLTVYISVCQRHRFESYQLPIATKRGWPKTIDFTKVPIRVKKMRKELEAIILDKNDVSDAEGLDGGNGTSRPRTRSVFWREVKKEVKKQGSRMVVGVKGQFASFEKTQPGYYGEQGSVIIHQTLFDLFPPSTFDASLIAPLVPAEFIQRVLVPEAAVRLIAQDLRVGIEDAVVTLRESAQYGVAMFPDTGENKRKGAGADDDEMDVADQIVMERARARRRELAAEEKVEKEMLEEERAAQRAKARESRRAKALERARQPKATKARAEDKVEVEVGDMSEVSEASATRGTRREARQWAVTSDSDSNAMSVDSLTSRQPTRIAKNKVRSDGSKALGATTQLNGSDTDPVELVGNLKHKASIRRSKAWERSAEPDSKVTAGSHKKSFVGFVSLNGDRDHESTPRPTIQITETAVGSSDGRILPLQAARNRPGARDPNTNNGWPQRLRTTAPNDSDSTMSDASRRSHNLVPAPMKKGDPHLWLFSEPSESDSP